MILYLLSLCVFLVSVQGAILPEPRIVGGTPITIYEHPHHVALLHRNPSGVFALACGGVIIRPDVILTAGQCTTGTDSNQWRVRAGSSYHSGAGGRERSVRKILLHPQFAGFPLLVNDLSLVYLSSELLLDDTTQLIKLPYQSEQIAVGTLANVTGWGPEFEGGPTHDSLRRVTVPIVDHNRCMNSYSGYVTITNNMLCAGVMGVGGQDFCQKDTGGPLVANGKVWGIASFGYSCGNPNFPGVYTKVSSYYNWINTNWE